MKRIALIVLILVCFPISVWALYDVKTQDNLAKWWITGTGSTVNRLSECMDDAADGPAIYHVDAADDWTSGAGANEWYVATTTKPDNVSENLAGWRNMTDAGDDQDGSLNVDEWSYDTGNNRVYIKLSDSSDPNDTDVRCDYDWDGAGAGPAIMTETVEDRVYLIHLDLDVGDGSTSTTLISLDEMVYFDDSQSFVITANATLNIGAKTGDWSINGSMWSHDGGTLASSATATLGIYGSMLHARNAVETYWSNGVLEVLNSNISQEYWSNPTWQRDFGIIDGTITLKDVYVNNFSLFDLRISDATVDDFRSHDCEIGAHAHGDVTATLSNAILTKTRFFDVKASTDANIILIDSIAAFSPLTILTDGKFIKEQYKVNMTIVDKDGTGIVGATVLCESSDSGTASTEYDVQEFSVDTGASGVLAEQTVTARKWVGTSETLTNYNYFKFTISEPGYETLVLDVITVDGPIDWHEELQPIGYPPSPWFGMLALPIIIGAVVTYRKRRFFH